MKKDYRELLGEINKLHEEYSNIIKGRKDIIYKIKSKINEIRNMTTLCNAELDDLERYYQYREYYISDYKLAMSLILRLLNSEENVYVMKEITTTGYYNTAGSEVNKLFGKITFITRKSLADKIDDHIYYFDEFKEKATIAINKGYPMIIVTSNIFEPCVKPNKNEVMCDNIYDIVNSGIIGNITCYANGIGFKNALDKFINYVNENGPDFTNIPEDTLFELMNDYKSNEKTLLK